MKWMKCECKLPPKNVWVWQKRYCNDDVPVLVKLTGVFTKRWVTRSGMQRWRVDCNDMWSYPEKGDMDYMYVQDHYAHLFTKVEI